jgi:hypothetical protein
VLRNLFYSVYATCHTEEWRLNVEVLLQHATVFNGRKIVVVRSGSNTHTPAEVEKAFEALGSVEFIHRANNPKLGEVEGFIEDFGRLYSLRSDEMTFYGHTKGARFPPNAPNIQAVRNWRNAMYRTCLGELDRVEEVIQHYPCVSSFKGNAGRNKHNWHYSGNYWWVRHDALFSADWAKVQQDYFGVESYLPDVFPSSAAFCLRFENASGLYTTLRLICEPCERVYPREIGAWLGNHAGVCPKCGQGIDVVREGSKLDLYLRNQQWAVPGGRNWRRAPSVSGLQVR